MLNIFKRNKKLFNCLCTVLLLFANLPLHAEESKIDLDKAITSSSKEIIQYFNKKEFKKSKANIAVVVSNTDTKDMADYLAKRFESEIKKSKNCQLLARSETDRAAIKAEVDLQYSGFVSDDKMVKLGNEAGAKYIVYVTFQQLDKKKELTVKTIEIETGKIIVGPKLYDIADSKVVEQLLKNTKKLVTLADYLEEMEKWKEKKRETERTRDNEIADKETEIAKRFADEIDKVNKREYPKNKSQEYKENDKRTSIEKLEKARAKEILEMKKNQKVKYEAEIKNYENKKENIISEMLEKEFTLSGEKLFPTNLGEFEPDAKPKQYFPVTFKSQDPNIEYNKEFKIEVKQDNDADYERINGPKEKGDIIGQLVFKLERIKGTDEFKVWINRVSVVTSSGAVLWHKEPNEVANHVPRKTSQSDNDTVEEMNAEVLDSSSTEGASTTTGKTNQSDVKTKAQNIELAAANDYWDDFEDEYDDEENSTSYFNPPLLDDGFYCFGYCYNYMAETFVKSEQLEKDVIFSKYEVHQDLYWEVMENIPSIIKGYYPYDPNNCSFFKYLPVENVTWFEAVAFCNGFTKWFLENVEKGRINDKIFSAYSASGNKTKGILVYYSDKNLTKPYTYSDAKAKKQVFMDKNALGWRLPTTDEWEVAAGRKVKTNWRGEKTTYYEMDYSGGNRIDELAWYSSNSDAEYVGKAPHEVGTKKANENGLYDMTGNVWEWCWSDCAEYSWSWSEYNVYIKGGCYYNDARHCRLDWVARQVPDHADKGIGFRICRTAPDSASNW